MTGVGERNRSGQYYVNTRLGVAKTQSENDFPEFGPETMVHQLLTDLIEVNAKGFRGVVVTALTGMHLNGDYDPINDFYGCNPRSIFEGGIWQALQEHGIPCGKSDPLNVAKNINQLDISWATGRRPQSAAIAVVKFLEIVAKASKRKRARLIDYFFFRLWRYSESIKNYEITSVDSVENSRFNYAESLINFSLEFPESGAIPQTLVAELLTELYQDSDITVHGGGESVFGTNTTSKKPADIWLVESGQETNLYEITVKPVSLKRLDDSIDALASTGHLDHSVTYICRVPEDIMELTLKDGVVTHSGKGFGVVDYSEFCRAVCVLLSNERFFKVLERMEKLVLDPHISMKTKKGWNKHFETGI